MKKKIYLIITCLFIAFVFNACESQNQCKKYAKKQKKRKRADIQNIIPEKTFYLEIG